MRLLHVVATGTRRGAEMFASDLVRALNGEGVAQRVTVLRGAGIPALPYDADVTMLDSNGWMVPGLRVDPVTVRHLRAQVGTWRPDILQVHGGEPLKYATLAGLAHRVPLVYRRIGAASPRATSGIRRAIYARLIRRADRMVAVAESVRREAIETFGIHPERIVTIPRGVDGHRLEPVAGRESARRSLGISRGAPVVLSLIALTWEKDPLAHIEVGSRVLAELSDAVHLLAGDGPMRAEVERAVRRQDLEGRVRLLGSRGDVPDLLAASDVVLLASRSEGMPGCLIEAGMAGRPVAAYRVGGVPEVVDEGVTGLLTPPGDAGALAGAVLRILGDRNEGRGMGRRARARCRSRFDIRVIAPRYVALYRELAGGTRGRRGGL